jgi:RNA polymerase sigma-70 factor (ECF subfamily)
MAAGEPQALLERARAGDGDALGALLDGFRPYARLLVRSLRRGRVPGRVDDSDLIQDAFLEAHRSFARFEGRSLAEFTSWLRAVVLRAAGHTLRSHLEAGKRNAGREEVLDHLSGWAAVESTPSQHAERHEQTARIAEAIGRLPEDMQQVLLGRHTDGLSYAALAERLGRTEGAVRVLYTRALRRLREECGG